MGADTKGMKGAALQLGAAGVEVRVKAGKDLSAVYSRSRKPVFGSGIMHSKFLRVGNSVVVGSTNFTTSSQANVETSVLIQLSADGLDAFRARFVQEWDGAVAYATALAAKDDQHTAPAGDD